MQTWKIRISTGMVKSTRGKGSSMTTSKMDMCFSVFMVLTLNLFYHQLLFSMASCLLHVTSSDNNEKIKIKNRSLLAY